MAAAAQDTLAAVTRRPDYWCGEFVAMASPCQVLSKADRATAQMQFEQVEREARRIEAKYSRYRAGNVVDKINSANGSPVLLDEETADLLDFAATLYRISDGQFDITSGVLREVWTFDGSDRLPGRDQVAAILERVGWEKASWERPSLRLAPGMQIDFGGIAKEYAVDRAAGLAGSLSDAPCLVNFGGDLAAVNPAAPWRVGIEAVDAGAGKPVKRIDLCRGGLATSGDARRFLFRNGVRYGHLLNPKTGWPVSDAPRSVTVAAETCTQAGMLSSLAMLKGRQAEDFLARQSARCWCLR